MLRRGVASPLRPFSCPAGAWIGGTSDCDAQCYRALGTGITSVSRLVLQKGGRRIGQIADLRWGLNPKTVIGVAFISIVSAWMFASQPRDARGETFVCAEPRIVVVATEDADTRIICAGAKDAIGFLSGNGLALKSKIEVNIVDKLPPNVRVGAYGCYDSRGEKIYVLEFKQCAAKFKNSLLFGAGPHAESYQALIAHEVAHVIVLQNYPDKPPPWVAQEYAAYVTQLATLPRQHRDRILATTRGEGFRMRNQINVTVLMASPEFFAVNAYRHFTKPENGAFFLRRLLAGELEINHRLSLPHSG